MRQVGATVGSVYLRRRYCGRRGPRSNAGRGAGQHDPTDRRQRELQPEEARTYSFGLDWLPSFLPDLRRERDLLRHRVHRGDWNACPRRWFLGSDVRGECLSQPFPCSSSPACWRTATPVNLPTPLPAIGNVLDQRLGNFGVRQHQWTGLRHQLSALDAASARCSPALAGNHILEFDTQLSPPSPVANSLQPRRAANRRCEGRAGIADGPGGGRRASSTIEPASPNTFNTPTGVSEFKADPYTTVDLRVTLDVAERGPRQRNGAGACRSTTCSTKSRRSFPADRWHRRCLQPDRTLHRLST